MADLERASLAASISAPGWGLCFWVGAGKQTLGICRSYPQVGFEELGRNAGYCCFRSPYGEYPKQASVVAHICLPSGQV